MKPPPRTGLRRFGPLLASALLANIGMGAVNIGPKVNPMVDPMLGFKPRPKVLNTTREQARRVRQRERDAAR